MKKTITRLQFITPVGSLQRTGISGSFCIKRGVLDKGTPVCLRNAFGEKVPVQTWPLAYWPDSTLKWMGAAIVAEGTKKFSKFTVTKEKPVTVKNGLKVKEDSKSVL